MTNLAVKFTSPQSHQKRPFLALVTANIEDVFTTQTELGSMHVEPMYENGMKFSGEVLVRGEVNGDVTEAEVSKVVLSNIKDFVEFAKVRKVELR